MPTVTGFATLHDPANAKLDIVFVHGLRGDQTATWTKGEVLWPRDLLSKDLAHARILAWGYNANIFSFWQATGKHELNGHSEQLVADLALERHDAEDRPIIFVAHSLGGLVCKNALVYAARNAEDHIQSIVNHTRGIVFLGTPHGGSDQKRWAQRGVTFAKFFGVSVDDQILKIFDEGSSKLIEVDSAFLEQLRKRNESEDSELGKVKVACFYEELPTTIGEVVTKDSAEIRGYECQVIPADHINMCKFKGPEEIGYRRISGVLQRWNKQLLTPTKTKKKQYGTNISVRDNRGIVGETVHGNTINYHGK